MKHLIGAALGVFALLLSYGPARADAQPPVVQIIDFAFKPSSLAIVVGQTVTFTNDDGEPHTVTADDKSFDSAGIDVHDSWRQDFTRAGTFKYFCALHPNMHGTVVVTASAVK